MPFAARCLRRKTTTHKQRALSSYYSAWFLYHVNPPTHASILVSCSASLRIRDNIAIAIISLLDDWWWFSDPLAEDVSLEEVWQPDR